MKYAIFLDSNQVFNNQTSPLDEPFNLHIKDLRDFLDAHNLSGAQICLPEIVVRERIQTKLEEIELAVTETNKNIKRLNAIGHSIRELPQLETYKNDLEKRAEKYINDNKVTRVATPQIDQKDLVERAILKRKPFESKKVGFKDALIYLSIVDHALSSDMADKYIFCCNDGALVEGLDLEFKKDTGKDLYLVSHILKVQEKLDELVPLRLELEKRNEKIKNLIQAHTGDFMHAINSDYPKRKSFSSGNLAVNSVLGTRNDVFKVNYGNVGSYSSISSGLGSRESEIEGYNYKDLYVNDITSLDAERYSVSVTIDSEVRYKDSSDSPDQELYGSMQPFTVGYLNSYNRFKLPERVDFYLIVECDLTSNMVSITRGPRKLLGL